MEQVVSFEVYKPLVSGIIAASIDRFYFRRNNITSNIGFGLAVGFGEVIADKVSSSFIPSSDYKSAETRVMEVGVSTVGAFTIDNMVTKSGALSGKDVLPRIISIFIADITSETLRDYMY